MFTVAEENPGNNKDLEDLHVLHEGKVVLFWKVIIPSNPPYWHPDVSQSCSEAIL